ncbi:MAG: protein kinase [Desulfobacterales bacterium]|jgi:serine/threonine protein kinase
MEDLTGKQLGRYQIVDQLGAGGMATVFKAYQPRMDRYVALKVLPRHFSKNTDFIHRFSQEARLIAKLEHPHILPVHDYGESDGYTYLVMRLVEGGSLSDLLKKHGKLELSKINSIISQTGGALDYAHKKGVIHRDFKPSNVLIDKFENCLLTDFGIAKMVEATSHLTHTGGILGTPTYISPEQGSGQPIDIRSDIYSLGIVLYQMVVGDVPFKADTPMAVIFKHIQDPLPLPREQVPDFPEPVERIILKALAKNPDDRYSTAIELVNALRSAIDQPTAQILEVQETVLDPDATSLVKETPTDKEELPTKPPLEPKLAIIKSKEIEEKKALPEHTEKLRTGRRWGYGALSIFLLAMFGGAGWYYFSNIFISDQAASRGILIKTKTSSGTVKEIQLYSGYHALVVGVSDYDSWPDLPYAKKDAQDVARVLKKMGFKVKTILNPSSSDLTKALNSLTYKYGQKSDRAILFYYAGHGETEKLADGTKLGYIIPKDCPLLRDDPEDFVNKAISMKDIEAYSLRIRSKHVLMLFDSCFSGSLFSLARAVPEDITEKSTLPVRQYITAGTEDEAVPDQSMFKRCLLLGLEGDADLTRDGYITGTELGLYLSDKVIQNTHRAQHPQYGKIRTPELARGDFIFHLASSGVVVEEVAPVPSKAYLSVKSNVSEAKVLMDGSYIGTTNLYKAEVSRGEHQISVEKEGYEPYTKTIRFEQGRTKNIFKGTSLCKYATG